VAEQFKRLRLSGPVQAAGRTTVVPISLNFPFFHKGPRDFTDTSRELPEYLSEVRRNVEPILGPLVKAMSALIEAGLRYERGEVSKAESVAETLAGNVDNLSPELRFCAMVLHEEILRVQGKDAEPETIGDMIKDTAAFYLSANYLAFTTNIELDNGDENAAVKWLEGQSPIRSTQLYKVYQHFTTAKAMMVTGKLSAAEKLLDRLVNFSSDYRRSADHIEALALRAVCLWRLKRTKESVAVFTDAILKAREFELIMPIIKNGGAVLPVLQKMLNRLKYGYGEDKLDKAFVNSLLMRSREISKHTPGMFSRAKSRPIKLSPRQSEVIGYLVQNLSYREIGAKMGVTVAAVDYHIRVLHEKFDALNTRELLEKAGELGFVEI
jgi:LuxR family maltose regulon positive regulatory protein